MIPRSETHVAHGYSLDDLYDIAVFAVRTDFVSPGIEWADRVAAAWSAAATELCLCKEPPDRFELVVAARAASADVITQTMKHHGRDRRGATYGNVRASFEGYWTCVPGSPLEDRVVDSVSLQQIWLMLNPLWREALLALSVHDDYAAAAASLGMKYHAFCQRVRRGRIEFLRLWHEGEAPSAVWGADKRKGRNNTGLPAVRLVARRARLAARKEEVSQ